MKLTVIGLPHPSLFPLDQAKFDCLSPEAPLSVNRHSLEQDKRDGLSLKFGRGLSTGDLGLTQFLQYGVYSRFDNLQPILSPPNGHVDTSP